MKKSAFSAIIALLIVVTLLVGGCVDPVPPDTHTVSVTAKSESLDLKDTEVESYDYTALFTVTKDDVAVMVEKSMLDLSKVSAEADSFTVKCTYENQSATVTVNVSHTLYEVTLARDTITLNVSLVEDYDFNSLFTVKVDGVIAAITDDMVSSNVTASVGEYRYTVTCGNASATLTVIVTDAHEMLAVASYKTLQLTLAQLETYDYTQLFSLYVDGEAVQVTSQMLDVTQLENAVEGGQYTVTFSYSRDSSQCSATTVLQIVPEAVVRVQTKNIVTYPNSDYIDLTTLFEVTKGDEKVTVTNDMISGAVDYSKEGINNIVLSYGGQTYTATVQVVKGVVINYAASDIVTVKVNTDKNTYVFADDFVVMINGVRFRNIADYIDVSQVDFSQTGEYTATLSVPYNEKGFGLSGATFTYYDKEIVYRVVDTEYSISVNQDVVYLEKGATSYNVFSNLSVVRNGRTNQVGDNVEWVNSLYCYGLLVSPAPDFSKAEKQLVEIDVYVNYFGSGDLGEAVRVSYYIQVQTDVVITAQNLTTFGHETIYTTELFTVTEGGQNVEVTYDMVSGKVDTFKAGVYTVTALYKGVSATAKVVVLNHDIVGEYQTEQTTIPRESSSDSEGYETDEGAAAVKLGDMVVSADGSIVVNGKTTKFLDAVDENTMRVQIGSYEYTMYYDNGIVVLDPDNNFRMQFHENMRPFVYFKKGVWEIEDYVTINTLSNHVLTTTMQGCSYDTFNIVATDGSADVWYALRTELVERTSSDTVYDVSWGVVQYADGFVPAKGTVSSLTFNGESLNFTMTSSSVGVKNKDDGSKLWAGLAFDGTVDGKSARLKFNEYEGATLECDGENIFSVGTYDYANMKNGGVNHAENILFVYSYDDETGFYSYKFLLDTESKTFTLLQQDGLFGMYSGDNKFIFVDGYGTGIANFDLSGYNTIPFTYTFVNQELKISFTEKKYTNTYGTYATFHMADLKNVLTAKYSFNGFLGTERLVNVAIVDGAVVNFTKTSVPAGVNCKQELVDSIQIITKDGELTYEQKTAKVGGKAVVDTSCVDVNKAGFYQVKINVTVNGTLVESYFSIQVLTDSYTGNALVATYGTGVANSAYSLSIDEYGRVFFNDGTSAYEGFATLYDGGFVARAFASNGSSVTLYGEAVFNGIVFVRCTGAVTFSDYFTTGESTVAGCEGNVLRKITANGNTLYLYSVDPTSLGSVAEVSSDVDDATVLHVTTAGGNTLVVKANWGDVQNGLVLSDSLRGVYTNENGEPLTLDGFGKILVGTVSGTYYAQGNAVTVTVSSTVSAYILSDDGTYQVYEVNFATLVTGKTYTATYNFTGSAFVYSATTSFAFGENGVVTVTSVCEEYETDEGEYKPVFGDKNGLEGSYTVSQNKLIVKINGQTFAFEMADVVQCKSIICQSTTLSEAETGYFPTGTSFVLS